MGIPKISRVGISTIAIGILLLVFPSRLSGWGLTWMGVQLEQLVTAARLRVGPFRINASLSIKEAGYNSNLYPGTGGPAVGDGTATGGSEVRLYLPLKDRVVFDLYDYPHYAFYLKTKEERAWNNIFRGQVHFVFQKLYVLIGGGFLNTRQPVSSEIQLRIRMKQDSLDGLALWQTSRFTSVIAQGRWTKFRYVDTSEITSGIPERLDRQEVRFNLKTLVQIKPTVRPYLEAEFGSYLFADNSLGRDSKSYSAFGGIEFLKPGKIQGTLTLGYKYFDHLLPTGIDYKGVVGNTLLTWAVSPMWEVRASLIRDAQFSAYSDFTYYILTSLGPGVSYQLSRAIRLSYDFVFGRILYPFQEADNGGALEYWASKYFTHSFVILFLLGQNVDLSLVSNFWKQDRIPGFDATLGPDSRVFIGFSLDIRL